METLKTYVPARLNTCGNVLTQRWFIYFYCTNPTTNKLQRVKLYTGFRDYKTVAERTAFGKCLVKKINRKLKNGWNYFLDKGYIQVSVKPEKSLVPAAVHAINKCFSIFLAQQKLLLRERTITTYANHIKHFKAWLPDIDTENDNILSITENLANDFIEGLTKKGLHNTTRNHYLGTLQTVFNFLIDKKIVTENPFKSIKKLKTNKQGSLYFKKQQIELLKKHISETDTELWFAIQFMFYCFLRPKEIRYLKIGDIDIWGEKIRIPGEISKKQKSDYVLIIKPFLKMIWESDILSYPGHYYIFGNNGEPGEKHVAVNYFRNKHKKYLEQFKFSNEYKFYSWKHTGICMAALSGLPLPFIQQQARHHSLDQLYAYLKRMGILDMENIKDRFPEL